MTIYKELIPTATNIVHTIKLNGNLIAIEKQYNMFVAYFEYNPATEYTYEIILCETGAEIPDRNWSHYNTFMMYGDSYVLHAMVHLKLVEYK